MHRPALSFTAIVLAFSCLSAKPSLKPELNDSRVYIPWQEFSQIIDRLSEPDTVAEDTIHAPTDYVLTSAEITGSALSNNSVRFTIRLALSVLPSRTLKENGWVTVKLGQLNSQAVLQAVAVDGKTLPLHTANNEYQLLFSKAGVYSLKLTYHCAVASNEGTNSIYLSLPKTMAAELDFTLADKHADVVVDGVKIPVEKAGEGIRIRTPLSTDNGVRIDYTPLGGIQEGGEDTTRITPRVYAATGLLADIHENRIRYQYRVDYQIWHKKITSFAIALPDTYAIEEVEGAGIARWKLEKREGKPVLLVQTNFTPEKKYSLTVRFSRKLENMADRIPVPSLQALNVNRENGCLAIASQQTMEVSVADSLSGLTAVDQSELHSWMQSRQDLFMRFKYIRLPYHLSLDVKRHSDMPVLVAIADNVEFTTLLTEEGYVLSRFRYHIRNNHKQYLRVAMPGGWRLWSALIDGEPVMPATSGEDEMLIPLKKTTSNDNGQGFRLELVYWKEWKKMGVRGTFSFAMPDIDINAQRINGDLWIPKNFKYGGFKGSLEKTASLARTAYFREPSTRNSSTIGQRQGKRFSRMATQQMTKSRKGVTLTLPVEITVPTEGRHFQFVKKLTISGEKADLSLSFRKRLPDLGKPFGLFFPLAFFLVGFIGMRVPLRRRTRRSIFISLLSGPAIMLLLLIIQASVHNTSPGMSMLFFGMVCGVLAHFAFASKNRTAGSAAALPLLLLLAFPPYVFSQDEANDMEFNRSTVALPWSDFKQILERIIKPELHDTASVAPPVASIIGSGDYHGERLNDKQCRFTARLDVSVLEKRSWVEIGLAQGAAVFPDVRVSAPPGGTAAVGTDASGNNALVVRGAGSYTVNYRFVVPIDEQSGVSTVRFPMPYQTATSVLLDLDKPYYRVTANGIPLAPHIARPGRTVYEGAIGRNSTATISWRQEVTQISAQDAMLLGQVNTFYSIGLGLIQMTSEIDLSVIHQAIREFTFSLPRPVSVVDLTGPAILTWEKIDTVGNNDRQTVRVLFKYRVRNRASFELTAEQSYGDSISAMSLPDLNLDNASRQEGFIAVGVTSNIELMQKDISANVLRKDRRELPPWFENADDILYSYQYLSGSYQLHFGVKRHDNISGLAALVEQEDARLVIREDGKTINEVSIKVKNRGEQFLRVAWKPGRQLWSLYCNGRPARPSYDSTTAELLVPLEKSAEKSAETSVNLVYLEQNKGFGIFGRHKLILPMVNMPSQNVNTTVYVPSPIDVVHTKGNLHPTESEKGRKQPWFSSVLRAMRNLFTLSQKDYIAADYYEKQPEEKAARLLKDESSAQRQTYSEEKQSDKKKIAPASRRRGRGGMQGGGGDPRARMEQRGALGTVTGQMKEKRAASAEMFGQGGYATDVDAVLQGQGGLKAGGSGGVGRKGVEGIGYGAGYGTGFGGSGSGGIDDLIGGLMGGDGGSPVEQQQAILPPSSSVESGQLSLPINVTFDGIPHTYTAVLLNSRESPHLSFLYRKTPAKIPFIVYLFIFVLTVIAGAFLTTCFWSGWSIRKVFYGIVVPLAAALALCRILGVPLGIDWVVIIPVLFFLWKAGVFIIRSLKARGIQQSVVLTEENNADGETSAPETTPSPAVDESSESTPPSSKGGN